MSFSSKTAKKMQICLTNSAFGTPSIFPFHLPLSTQNPLLSHKIPVQTHLNAVKRSEYLSEISKAIDQEEQYRIARSQVLRKGVDLEGYSIEGLSIGGQETCVIIPEFKCAFDIGRCPTRAIQQNFVFITHAHLDHIDVEKLMDIHRTMGQVELDFELVALDVGETFELRNNLVVRPFRTQHVIPSQGYVIYSVRKKLKKQYIHLKGSQIEKLKKSGVEITDTILSPEVAFTGDTTADFMLDPRNADALRAKILITEATFLDDSFSVEHARQHGHTHLSEIIGNAEWIHNKAVLLTHFSSRYNVEDIRQAAAKLQSKLSAKVVPFTEGFKSKYS